MDFVAQFFGDRTLERSTSSFLCYFSVRFGTIVILIYSLIQAIYSLAMAAGSIIWSLPVYGYGTSSTTQLFSAAWNLGGIPLIGLGFWAVSNKNGPVLRLFLYYLIASFFVDAFFLIDVFFIKDACAHLDDQIGAVPSGHSHFGTPLEQVVKDVGVSQQDKAFACGIARGTSSTLCCILFAIMAYSVYIVWAHIAELTDGGSAAAISRLMTWEEREEQDWIKFQEGVKIKHDGKLYPSNAYAGVPYASL